MNLLDTLIRAADEEQLHLHPLPEHAAATQAEHLRRHYALLLAAVLTAQPAVSEPQARLLRLLLDSLKLGDIRGPLFEQARKLTPEPLLEAARLIREAGFARHLVLDALVLLRLDAPLGDDAVRLVGELACFLDIGEDELALRADDAAEILGLHAGEKNKGGGDGPAAEWAVERSRLLADHWPNRLRQALTVEALRKGLQGSLCTVDADLDVDFPWKAENVTFLFRNGATLRTVGSHGEVKLSDCRLFNAALEFEGSHASCSVTLERCNWRGDYDPTAKRTALECHRTALTVIDSNFVTLNARAIRTWHRGLTVKNSVFTHCGHAELYGGAVWHSDHDRTIEGCRFDRCVAALGGALRFNKIYGINKCKFLDCKSKEKIQGFTTDEDSIAIFANSSGKSSEIIYCTFQKSSLLIINFSHHSASINETCFQKSTIYFQQNTYGTNLSLSACSLTSSNITKLPSTAGFPTF